MDKGRIPVTLIPFHTHLGIVNQYLHKADPETGLARGEMLGMLPQELLKLQGFYDKWATDDPNHPGIWNLHSQSSSKTELTRLNVVQFMKEFGIFFRPLLVRMSGSSNINSNDRLCLRIAEPVTRRSKPTLPISENCNAEVTAIGTGRISTKCRYSHESNRAGKPPRADAVEIAYALVLPHQFSPSGEPLPLMQLKGPDDNTIKMISTKASFLYELGAEKMGYQMQYFARWINTKHPSINGPWTGMWAVFIG